MSHWVQQDITLQEALCGFSFNITHLDQRVLQVRKQQMAIKSPMVAQSSVKMVFNLKESWMIISSWWIIMSCS